MRNVMSSGLGPRQYLLTQRYILNVLGSGFLVAVCEGVGSFVSTAWKHRAEEAKERNPACACTVEDSDERTARRTARLIVVCSTMSRVRDGRGQVNIHIQSNHAYCTKGFR